MSKTEAAKIREQLGHPVVDVDGHMLEFLPAVFPFLREALGPRLFESYRRQGPAARRDFERSSDIEATASRMPQIAWWGCTNDPLERATVMLPELLYERMEDLGLDYCVLFTTNGLSQCSVEDDELRAGICRGFNDYYAEVYGPFRERLAPAGMIPMHSPTEALAELDHCKEIGLKAVVLPEGVLRPTPAAAADVPNPLLWPGQRHWFDRFGLDSAYDYDPVWKRALEHGFAITFHGQLANCPGTYTSPNNYCYNHLGMFAGLMFPLCKSLFMGGVTARVPDQAFGFLECGVSWAAQLLADSVEHWEKRRLPALERLNPAGLDFDALDDYVKRYGGPLAKIPEQERRRAYAREAIDAAGPEQMDDWAQLAPKSAEELCERFTEPFYFGCEADDRGVAAAFSKTNPFGVKLKAMFSSDIGHWDVEQIEAVLPEAFGLVKKGVLDEEQFFEFAFAHSAEMLLNANPAFFEGTPVESAAAALRGASGAEASTGAREA
ncbi:MAG: amidohydrolase family protein [Myxococcota bacterium]